MNLSIGCDVKLTGNTALGDKQGYKLRKGKAAVYRGHTGQRYLLEFPVGFAGHSGDGSLHACNGYFFTRNEFVVVPPTAKKTAAKAKVRMKVAAKSKTHAAVAVGEMKAGDKVRVVADTIYGEHDHIRGSLKGKVGTYLGAYMYDSTASGVEFDGYDGGHSCHSLTTSRNAGLYFYNTELEAVGHGPRP